LEKESSLQSSYLRSCIHYPLVLMATIAQMTINVLSGHNLITEMVLYSACATGVCYSFSKDRNETIGCFFEIQICVQFFKKSMLKLNFRCIHNTGRLNPFQI